MKYILSGLFGKYFVYLPPIIKAKAGSIHPAPSSS